MANEHDRKREDEDERDRDIMDRDEAIAVDEAASSVTCAICGKEIPHGLRPECDQGGKVFCDGCASLARSSAFLASSARVVRRLGLVERVSQLASPPVHLN